MNALLIVVLQFTAGAVLVKLFTEPQPLEKYPSARISASVYLEVCSLIISVLTFPLVAYLTLKIGLKNEVEPS